MALKSYAGSFGAGQPPPRGKNPNENFTSSFSTGPLARDRGGGGGGEVNKSVNNHQTLAKNRCCVPRPQPHAHPCPPLSPGSQGLETRRGTTCDVASQVGSKSQVLGDDPQPSLPEVVQWPCLGGQPPPWRAVTGKIAGSRRGLPLPRVPDQSP